MSWTAGNPAALPFEVDDAWTSLAGSWSRTGGEYRRPLDAQRDTRTSTSALAMGRVGAEGGAIGSVEVGRVAAAPGSAAVSPRPYNGSPFIVADAESPRLVRIDAALDGAYGTRLGDWGVGLGLGYAAAEERTADHPIVRFVREVSFAGAAGLVREFPHGIRAGLHVSAAARRETMIVTAERGATDVFPLIGYTEPERLSLVQPEYYFRRVVRNDLGVTASLGAARQRSWVVYATATRGEERGARARMALPEDPHDRWSVRKVRTGVAIRTAPGRSNLIAGAEWSYARGEGLLPGIDEVVFSSSESRLDAGAVWRPADVGQWQGIVGVHVSRVRALRNDRLSELASDLVMWTPGATLTVARKLSGRVALELTYRFAAFQTAGRIPDLDSFGDVSRDFSGGELLYYSRRAIPQGADALLRLRTGITDLFLGVSHDWASPRGTVPHAVPQPTGQRTITAVRFGIRPRRVP